VHILFYFGLRPDIAKSFILFFSVEGEKGSSVHISVSKKSVKIKIDLGKKYTYFKFW